MLSGARAERPSSVGGQLPELGDDVLITAKRVTV